MPQLIQYRCPSWCLTLQDVPLGSTFPEDSEALGQATLTRLSSDRPESDPIAVAEKDPQVGQVPQTPSPLEEVAWQGDVTTLIPLHEALQHYIQQLLQRSSQSWGHCFTPPTLPLSPNGSDGAPTDSTDDGTIVLEPIPLPPQSLTPNLPQPPDETSTFVVLEGNPTPDSRPWANLLHPENGQPLDLGDDEEPDWEQLQALSVGIGSSLESPGLPSFHHQLQLEDGTVLHLSTLECFDLGEVLGQWQREMIERQARSKDWDTLAPNSRTAWIKITGLIALAVSLSTGVSLVASQWWFQRQQMALTAAMSANSGPDSTLDSSVPGHLPALESLPMPAGAPAIPQATLSQGPQVYGPPAPGLYGPPALTDPAAINLGIQITGEQSLPISAFAGLPAPPPPDFGPLPPPPAELYAANPLPYRAEAPQRYGDSGGNLGPAPYPESQRLADNYSGSVGSVAQAPPAVQEPARLSASRSAEAAGEEIFSSAMTANDAGTIAPESGRDGARSSDSGGSGPSRGGDVQAYFQSSWFPQDNVDQPLSYQLLVNGDGSLGAIVPLSETAGVFLDRTGMPLLGDGFVSPGPEEWLVVTLYPDGGVSVSP